MYRTIARAFLPPPSTAPCDPELLVRPTFDRSLRSYLIRWFQCMPNAQCLITRIFNTHRTTQQQKRCDKYREALKGSLVLNDRLRDSKAFRNPSIMEKLVAFCGIDEAGTNFPKDLYNPHRFTEAEYHEALGSYMIPIRLLANLLID